MKVSRESLELSSLGRRLRKMETTGAQPGPHTHTLAECPEAQTALALKADAAHTHAGLVLTTDARLSDAREPLPHTHAAPVAQTEIDFGARAVRSASFTVTDPQVTPSSRILAYQSGEAAAGQQSDNNEMDAIAFRAAAGSGQFTLYASVTEGFAVLGRYKVDYLRG